MFSHEMPDDKDDPLAKQNVKDRYHGRNDPVARKMLSGYAATKNLIPPEDQSVVRLAFKFPFVPDNCSSNLFSLPRSHQPLMSLPYEQE
jgi:hypothetical protein